MQFIYLLGEAAAKTCTIKTMTVPIERIITPPSPEENAEKPKVSFNISP